MTSQRESFEKWFTELEPHTVFNYDSPVENFAWWGWQAAQADQAERVKELEIQNALYADDEIQLNETIAQLQLENDVFKTLLFKSVYALEFNKEFNLAEDIREALGETK